MKPLTGTQRTMLRIGGHAKKLVELIAEKAKIALTASKLVT